MKELLMLVTETDGQTSFATYDEFYMGLENMIDALPQSKRPMDLNDAWTMLEEYAGIEFSIPEEWVPSLEEMVADYYNHDTTTEEPDTDRDPIDYEWSVK